MRLLLSLALCLCIHSLKLNSQNAPINFETNGFGASWTWNVFENSTNPPLEFIENPDKSGINTSDKVAKFTALKSGEAYAGTESIHGSTALGPFVLGPSNSKIKIMVWKSVISDVGIKFASSTNWSQGEKKVSNTKINQWEELTFDFSTFNNPPSSQGQLDQIIIFPDFKGGRAQDNIIYFDNIRFTPSDTTMTTEDTPIVAAPTPTRSPANVVSMFSHPYTNVTVDTWRTDWSSALLADIKIESNDTKKYTNLNFVGIETVTKQLDVTNMSYMHIDMWTPNVKTFKIKLVDFGADGAFAGGDDTEHEVIIENPTLKQWNSLDIPLSQFVNLKGKKNIAQLIFSGLPASVGTAYIDNVYFFNLNSSTNDIKNDNKMIVIYPNPLIEGQSLDVKGEYDRFEIFNIQGQSITSGNKSQWDDIDFQKGVYVVAFLLPDKTISRVKLIVK